MLTIAEDLFLLACHRPDGRYSGHDRRYGPLIAMGAIHELVYQEGLVVDVADYIRDMELTEIFNQMTNKPEFPIRAYDRRPTGDPVLDYVMLKIGNRHDLTAKQWAPIIGRDAQFIRLVERNLIGKRLLKKVQKRKWLLFPFTSLEGDRMQEEAELRMRLYSAVNRTSWLDDRTASALSIVHNTPLSREIFQDKHKEVYYVLRDYIESRSGFESILWLIQTSFDIRDFYKIRIADLR